MKTRSLLFSAFLSILVSCGGPETAQAPARALPPELPNEASEAGVPEAGPMAPAPPKNAWFENRGGMWMPHQMEAHAETLKKLGVSIDPSQLADPLSPVLASVISLGGCSASFVSSEGLVITNHHCATGALQLNSTPSQNLLKDGFMAKDRASEKSNGPGARAFVTRKVTNVTGEFQKAITQKANDLTIAKSIDSQQKKIVAECEKGHPGIKCAVARFYNGSEFYLIEQLEIRDLRLVYAPTAGIGNYGGEIDNWRWPRHTGDFTFFRAYVGKDGNPADYAPDNVPFRPAHHLKMATTPLVEGDFVAVAGYPGRTQLLRTFVEADAAVAWSYPRRVAMCNAYLALLKEIGDKDPEVQVKATPLVRRFGNALTNAKGQLEGLVDGGLLTTKRKEEDALQAFIKKTPERRSKYGRSIEDIRDAVLREAEHREADAALHSEILMPKLMSAASTIVRMAEERAKPDAERDPDYQERRFPDLINAQQAIEKQYHKELDKALLRLALERILRTPKSEQSKALEIIAGKAPTKASIAQAVESLYATTNIESNAKRIDLMKRSTQELKKENDSLINVAFALRPLLRESEEREKALTGLFARTTPRYIAALRDFKGEDIAPDANSTLRVTYGVVRGYTPKSGAQPFFPFTYLDEMLRKNTGKDPFLVPERLLSAVREKKFGGATPSTMPVDFLSTLHITGGNSGSATLNAAGELVGLAFDGNYESVASDWLYVPSVTRSIHVDIRYVRWLLESVDDGTHLLREMGLPN